MTTGRSPSSVNIDLRGSSKRGAENGGKEGRQKRALDESRVWAVSHAHTDTQQTAGRNNTGEERTKEQ